LRRLGTPFVGGDADFAAKLRQAERRLEKQRERIRKQNRELAELRDRVADGGELGNIKPENIKPENIAWIFGTARTGSTWLAFMMEEIQENTIWREPYVGELFGRFYYSWVGNKHFQTKHFILGDHKESWLKSLRSFVLSEANARFPRVKDGGYLIVKEPNGSVGAPLIMEALPESRLIFLVRDPRDVIASSLDAFGKDSWLYERRIEEGGERTALFDMQADELVEKFANRYAQNIRNVKEAYEKHKGPKVLIKYEELRRDTLGTMRRLFSTLGMPADDAEIARAVEKHAWENVPEEAKGSVKFYRKASPGSWRNDLTPGHAEMVERITAPLLEAFYP
jgi:hypothetical protein